MTNEKPFDNFETLDCGGFVLTGITNDFQIEAAGMVLATQSKNARKFLSSYPATIEEAYKKMGACVVSFHEKKALTYVIKADGLGPIGFVHVYTPDNSTEIKDWLIEYYLAEQFWRQGIMTVAVQTVLAFLQENDVKSIKAIVDVDNYPSKRILQKFGFVLFAENPTLSKEVYALSL